MNVKRENELRSMLDGIACGGQWSGKAIKKLPIVANTPIDEVLNMRTGVAKACAEIVAKRQAGAHGEARRLAYETAQQYGAIVDDFKMPARGGLDEDESDPRKLAEVIRQSHP